MKINKIKLEEKEQLMFSLIFNLILWNKKWFKQIIKLKKIFNKINMKQYKIILSKLI